MATLSTSAGVSAFASLTRSEEHTSELQSRQYLVCRLLLEKKKKKQYCVNSHRSPSSCKLLVDLSIIRHSLIHSGQGHLSIDYGLSYVCTTTLVSALHHQLR